MIHLSQAVIVEGEYDKIKLSSILDAVIIETGGFSIFKDRERLDLIRRLADTCGIIIMTDSDAAGFKIRSFIGGALPKDRVFHVYIPDLFGKEHRKAQPSKEGKLGVEGIPVELIVQSLERCGVTQSPTDRVSRRITKADLFEDGLTGGADSSAKRRLLLTKLGLPQRLSSNMLLDVLNATISFDAYKSAVDEIK